MLFAFAKAVEGCLGLLPFAILVTSVPHYGATLLRVYARKEDREKYLAKLRPRGHVPQSPGLRGGPVDHTHPISVIYPVVGHKRLST
jgi:hypothetical protein